MYLQFLSRFLRSSESLRSHAVLLTSSFTTGLGLYGLHQYQTLTINDLYRPSFIWGAYWLPVALLWYVSWIVWSVILSRRQNTDLDTTLREDAVSYVPTLLFLGLWFKHTEIPVGLAVIPALAAFTALKLRPFLPLTKPGKLLHRRCLTLVVGGMVAYAVTFSIMGSLRIQALRAFADFALFVQQVWNFSNFDYDFLLGMGWLPLGNHFSPILFFLAPFYWIWEHPVMIVVVQNTVISLGALPLYWMASERLESPVAGLAVAGTYLLYPGIQYPSLGDFHESLLAGTPILFGFYYLHKKLYRKAWVFIFLVLMCKEDMPFIIFMFGVYTWLFQRQRRQGLAILTVAVLWSIVSAGIIIPLSQGGDNWFLQFLPSAILSADTSPSLVERLGSLSVQLFSINHLVFMLRLLVPVGVLAVLAPAEFLIGVPTLLELMLYTGPPFGLIGNTYTWHVVAVVPAFFVGAIFGIERLMNARWFQNIPGNRAPRTLCITYLFLSSICASVAYGAFPYSITFRTDDFQISPHARIGHEIIAMIPPGVSVTTSSPLSPLLAHRKELYMLPTPFKTGFWLGKETLLPKVVDYVVVDTSRAVLNEMTSGQDVEFLDVVRFIGQHPDYSTVIAQDGYVVFRHNRVSTP